MFSLSGLSGLGRLSGLSGLPSLSGLSGLPGLGRNRLGLDSVGNGVTCIVLYKDIAACHLLQGCLKLRAVKPLPGSVLGSERVAGRLIAVDAAERVQRLEVLTKVGVRGLIHILKTTLARFLQPPAEPTTPAEARQAGAAAELGHERTGRS